MRRLPVAPGSALSVPFKDVSELDFAQWKRTQEINLDSQFLMIKVVMSSMRDHSWGGFVNFAAQAGDHRLTVRLHAAARAENRRAAMGWPRWELTRRRWSCPRAAHPGRLPAGLAGG